MQCKFYRQLVKTSQILNTSATLQSSTKILTFQFHWKLLFAVFLFTGYHNWFYPIYQCYPGSRRNKIQYQVSGENSKNTKI